MRTSTPGPLRVSVWQPKPLFLCTVSIPFNTAPDMPSETPSFPRTQGQVAFDQHDPGSTNQTGIHGCEMFHRLESLTATTSNPEKHSWIVLYWCEWLSDLLFKVCADGIVSNDGSLGDGMCEDGETLKWATSRPVTVSPCKGCPSRYLTSGYKR